MLSLRKRAVVPTRLLQSTSTRTSGPKLKISIPNGCLFAPLQGGNRIAYSHPLDDEPGYKRFLKEDLLKECGCFVYKYPTYRNYMVKMLEYTLPAFHTCWTFGPELVYRFVAPMKQQTLENKWKCRILRACVELIFASSAVIDDITDHSDMRLGKPSWKMVSAGGMPTAIFDGQQLDTLPYLLVKKHFRNSPGYSLILETLAEVTLELLLGQTLDVLSHNNEEGLSSYASSSDISRAKAGSLLRMQPIFGLLHVGVLDQELLRKADEVFSETGILIQNWDKSGVYKLKCSGGYEYCGQTGRKFRERIDEHQKDSGRIRDDFCDYYCTTSQMGKPSNDSKNAGNTWASSVAMEHFSESEKITFKECYGSEDPQKMEVVRQLYNSIDLPSLYVDYVNQRHLECNRMVKDFQYKPLEEACYSWLQWLMGDHL